MTTFHEAEHPRAGDGRFAVKRVTEANIDSLIVHGEPAIERVQNVLRDAVERGELSGQCYIEYNEHDQPYAEFTDASGARFSVEASDSMIFVDHSDTRESLVAESPGGGWEGVVAQLPAAVSKAQARFHDRKAFNELAAKYGATQGRGPLSQPFVNERLGEFTMNGGTPDKRVSLRELQSADPEHGGKPTARLRIGGGPDEADEEEAFDCLVVPGPYAGAAFASVYVDGQDRPLPRWQASAALAEASRRLGSDSPALVTSFITNAATASATARTAAQTQETPA